MQVNILEAKNQLSRLIKAAVDGEEVVIASNGKPMVRLVPCSSQALEAAWGRLVIADADIDAAFAPETDKAVADLFERSE